MLALRVKYGEPLERYYYSKLNLLNRCRTTAKRAVECNSYAIDDRAVKVGAQAAQFQSPEEVLIYLKTVKVVHVKDGGASSNTNRVDKRHIDQYANKFAVLSSRKPPIKCFSCGVEGHISFKYRKPFVKCSICYKLGHNTTTCPALFSKKLNEDNSDKTILRVDWTEIF